MGSEEIRKKFKKARKELGLTQKEVAKKAGIHFNHYNRIENGKAFPSIKVAEKIARALRIKSLDVVSS